MVDCRRARLAIFLAFAELFVEERQRSGLFVRESQFTELFIEERLLSGLFIQESQLFVVFIEDSQFFGLFIHESQCLELLIEDSQFSGLFIQEGQLTGSSFRRAQPPALHRGDISFSAQLACRGLEGCGFGFRWVLCVYGGSTSEASLNVIASRDPFVFVIESSHERPSAYPEADRWNGCLGVPQVWHTAARMESGVDDFRQTASAAEDTGWAAYSRFSQERGWGHHGL